MTHSYALAFLVVGAALTAACAGPIQAKIPMDIARETALGRVQGEVLAEELEREDGRAIYSFEIKPSGAKRGTVKEVEVDANTGEVLDVAEEALD
jgi:uncharacterized membrane protein YkoI